MNSTRKATTIAGVLFILATIAGMLSIAPSIDAREFLVKASANTKQVMISGIFQFAMATAYVGFAISLYPILKKYNESFAIGFVGFRLIAGMFNIIGVIIMLLILALSREFVNNSVLDTSYFHTLGELLRGGRDLINHVAMILSHCLGGLMLYSILYKTNLVPRWLSSWGFAGTTLTILASLFVMFRLIGIITPLYIVLSIPMALQEIILAIWLIVKGVNPPPKDVYLNNKIGMH